MDKVIRDGKVAVLTSPGFGLGWYTWHDEQALLFHPTIVELVEQGKRTEITEELCQQLLGKDSFIYIGGAEQLVITWLPEGTAFRVEEYDGSESLILLDDLRLTA